jgi:hypothetical protein
VIVRQPGTIETEEERAARMREEKKVRVIIHSRLASTLIKSR